MISASNCKSQYDGNDSATTFPYVFPVTDKAEVKVVKTSVSGTDTVLTVDVDYTVNGVDDPDSANWNVTYPVSGSPLADGEKLTIVPGIEVTQTTEFNNQGPFLAENHEKALDRLTLIAQQQQEQIDRCIKTPLGGDTEFTTGEYLAAVEANAAASSASADDAEASAIAAAASAALIKAYDDNQYATGAGTNTYTASLTPALPAYIAGMEVAVKFPNANTGAATLNINGLGAKDIQNKGAALAAGDIAANLTGVLRYDGTAFQLLNPAVTLPSSLALVPVRQTVLSGATDSSGLPSILPSTSGSLSITSQNVDSTTALVVTAAGGFGASGQVDRVGRSTANITWAGLTASATNYLYVDVAANGTLTAGSTILAPVYQSGGARSTTSGQFTFNISEMSATVGDGSSANSAYRVFVGEAVTSGSAVTSTVAYGYCTRCTSARVALPASGVNTTISHNLGLSSQLLVQIIAVCVTTEGGYSVGDEILIPTGLYPGYYNYGLVSSLSGRNSAIVTSGSGGITFMQKSTSIGESFTMTSAKWQMYVITRRGW